MDITDIIMIFAVFLGPIFAVQIQKHLEIKRESRNRKLYIFHTLMSTRATTLSQNHVTALNMIDIDFYNNKKVIDAWRIYYDHLNSQSSNENIIAWSEKCVELLGRVEHWRQINGKKNSERLIFKFSHKKDIVRYASHYAQR